MNAFVKVAACLTLAALHAIAEEGMPSWVLPGLLHVETRSFYRDGEIVYVDRRVGTHGEVGPFQITRAAFDDVAEPGETFSRLRRSPEFGEVIAVRILTRHYRATGYWEDAVRRYHVGAGGSYRVGLQYLSAVRISGRAYLLHPVN